MTEIERLIAERDEIDTVLIFLHEAIQDQESKRNQVTMKLNRARRLEREELQNAQASRN